MLVSRGPSSSSVVPSCSAGADNRNGAAWQEGPRLHSARYLALCAGIKLMQGVRASQEECFYKFQHCAKCNSKKNKCMACNAPFAVTPQGHCVCPIGWQAATNQFGETTCLSPGITQLEPYVQNISSQITNLTTVVQTITQVPPASALQCVCRHAEATCAARSGPEVPKGGRAPGALYRLMAHGAVRVSMPGQCMQARLRASSAACEAPACWGHLGTSLMLHWLFLLAATLLHANLAYPGGACACRQQLY